MSIKSEMQRTLSVWDWLLAGIAILFGLASLFELLWLLWKFVPLHAAVFEGMGLALPSISRLAIILSNWCVRLLPIIFVSCVLVSPIIFAFVALAGAKFGIRAVSGILTTIGLGIAIAALCGSSIVVYGIQAGYYEAATNPDFQKNLRACEEWRQQQKKSNVE
jgi:hypothetical protein